MLSHSKEQQKVLKWTIGICYGLCIRRERSNRFQLKKLHVCGNCLTVHYFRYMIQKKKTKDSELTCSSSGPVNLYFNVLFFFFFSFLLHILTFRLFSKESVRYVQTKIICTCARESVLRRSFYVLIDNKSKYRGMALNRHRIKPEKTINELKKPNHILFLHNNVP